MTRTSIIARPLLALAAALLAAPLAAEEPVTVTGQPVYQERVSFADLDLRNSDDRQKLKGRVHRASDRVCIAAEGPIPRYSPSWGRNGIETCSDLTYDAAHPQIAAAIDRARSGQLVTTRLVVSAPRAR